MGKWITSKVYTLEYLENEELTEEDLYNLFDKSSLILSLILAEFRIIGDTRKDWEIIKETKTVDLWQDNHFFKYKQWEQLTNSITKIYMNIYKYSEEVCRQNAEDFMFKYGFPYT